MFKKRNKEQKPKIFDEPRLLSYVTWLLSRKDYSEAELKNKMMKYQEDIDMISRVLAKVKSYGYINEDRMAENLIVAYSKKESLNKVKRRLSEKGINKDTIDEKILSFRNDDNELKVAIGLLRKKFKQFDVNSKNKYIANLASKGYSWNIISKSLDYFSSGEELEED